jgi:hypothetical protein
LLYLLPWIAVPVLYALARALRRGTRDERSWLFACLAAPPIVVFALIALWAKVLPHWAAIGWLFGFPLLGGLLATIEARRPHTLRSGALASAVFLICVVSLFVSQAATGWIERLAPGFAAHDPTLDFMSWRGLRPAVTAFERRPPGGFVATVSWIDAGKADYALGGAVPVLCLSTDPRQFAYLRDARSYAGGDALIVAAGGRPDWLRSAAPHFQRIEPGEDLLLRRAGRAALTLHTAVGYGFSPDPARGASR